LEVIAARCNSSVLRCLGRREPFFFLFFCSLGISPTDGRHVNPWRADFLSVLKPELFHDQLGVPEVGLEFEARSGSPHHAVEHLPFCCLALALADPLGLDLVLLGQDGLHPV